MASPRILVTGGAGFVGAEIVREIAASHPEWTVSILDAVPEKDLYGSKSGREWYQADVKNIDQVLDAVKRSRADTVIHAAGVVPKGLDRYSQRDRNRVFDLNFNGTKNMLSAAKTCGVKYFVLTSSSQVISDDNDHEYPNLNESVPIPEKSLVYGESKAMAERLVLDSNTTSMATCALRPSVILGPEDYQLIPTIHKCIAKGETPFVIGSGDNLYDFTYIENVAYAHVLAITNLFTSKSAAGEAILISNAQPVTFRDFCLAVWAEFGHAPSWEVHIPLSLAWFAGYMAEWVSWITNKPITLCRGSVRDASTTRYADLAKARHLLGYTPKVHLVDGLKRSCEAYKKRLNLEVAKDALAVVRTEHRMMERGNVDGGHLDDTLG